MYYFVLKLRRIYSNFRWDANPNERSQAPASDTFNLRVSVDTVVGGKKAMYRVLDFTTMNQKAGNQIHNRFHYQKEYEQLKEPLILASLSLSLHVARDIDRRLCESVFLLSFYYFRGIRLPVWLAKMLIFLKCPGRGKFDHPHLQ